MTAPRNSDQGSPTGSPPGGGTQHRAGSTQHRAGSTDGVGGDGAGSGAAPDLEIGQFSHPGCKRSNNEDWLGTFQPEDTGRLAQKGSLFLLADGMGGQQSGETASRQAVDRTIRAYMEDRNQDIATSLQRAVEAANTALYNSASRQQQGQNSGTTLVTGVIRRRELWVANVGDSRAYLLRRGVLEQISKDHSWAAAGARAGLGEEWVGRHVLTRALGTRSHVDVDIFGPFSLETGDRLLLCSDGLTTPLADAEIGEIAGRCSPQEACEALVQAANERGGPDNVSVLMVEVRGPGPQDRVPRRAAQNQQLKLPILGNLKRLLPPRAVVAVAVLGAMLLLGLGFALGLLLFGH